MSASGPSASILLRAALVLAALAFPARLLRAQDWPRLAVNPSASPVPAEPATAPASADASAAGSSAADTTNTDNSPTSSSSPDTDQGTSLNDSEFFPPYDQSNGAGVQGLRQNVALPENAFGEPEAGVPYSSVLTKTGADLNDIGTIDGSPLHTGIDAPTKFGNVEGSSGFSTGNLDLGLPFFHSGTEPQDADIKAGPLYVKFHSIDGLVLYDDNFRRVNTDRRSTTLVLLRLNLTVIAQLAENLQFAVSGSISYLPTNNQVGVEAPTFSSLGLFLYGAPLFASQLVYDAVIASWPVRFADDFRINTGSYSDSTRDSFDLFQGDYLTRDPNGAYFFRSARINDNGEPTTSNPSDFDGSVVYLSNSVSALTDHLLPGDVRLTVRLDHENLWYNQNGRGLPPGRDDLFVGLVSERESLRFKPYASYEASFVEGSNGDVTQIFRAGFLGPIDDQLFLRADAGFYVNANNHTGEIYQLALDHVAGPNTSEHLVLDRSLSAFNDEVTTSEYYLLEQTLGATMTGSLFVDNYSTQDLVAGPGDSYDGELAGAQISWALGPKTNMTLSGIAERREYDRGPRTDTVTGRVILNRTLTDTLTFQLLYQYQRTSSNNSGFSYYENLVYFRIVKFLD